MRCFVSDAFAARRSRAVIGVAPYPTPQPVQTALHHRHHAGRSADRRLQQDYRAESFHRRKTRSRGRVPGPALRRRTATRRRRPRADQPAGVAAGRRADRRAGHRRRRGRPAPAQRPARQRADDRAGHPRSAAGARRAPPGRSACATAASRRTGERPRPGDPVRRAAAPGADGGDRARRGRRRYASVVAPGCRPPPGAVRHRASPPSAAHTCPCRWTRMRSRQHSSRRRRRRRAWWPPPVRTR